MFITTASAHVMGNKEPPSQNSIEDRFKMVVSTRRRDLRETEAASGIVGCKGRRRRS